jgi:hypothetical protein
LLLYLLDVGDAGAQHIRGRLLDVNTGTPIPVGFLSLLREDSTVVATAISDANGLWQLNAPRPGAYLVAAERIGYRRWVSGPVTISARDQLESVFHLQPAPLALDTMFVEAEAVRRYLQYNGFFERQRGSFGHFVTPADVEKRQASRVTDLLTAIPGVQRVAVAEGSAGPMQIQLRGSSLSQGGMCRPRIFVDGLIYTRGDARPVRDREGNATERAVDQAERMDQALSLDDIGHPSTVAAIEVYRSAAQVPVQFGGSSVETLCGVIVVWTRTGRMRTGGR